MTAFVLGLPETKVRVIAPDVGGGFGSKIFLYPEETAMVWASKKVNRPIKWTADRSEAFLTDAHGRDHVTHAEMALDKDGKFLALRVKTIANLGAYLSTFASCVPTILYATLLAGQYKTPAIYCEVTAVFTNTAPVDAYRGAGRPEATYVVERLVETAAREMKIDPAEIRRRNFITDLPVPDAGRADVRHRQLTPRTRQGDRDGRRRRLPRTPRRVEGEGQAARHRLSRLHRGLRHRAVEHRRRARRARRPVRGRRGARASDRQRHGVHRLAQPRPGPRDHVRAGGRGALGIPVENVEIVHGDTGRVPFGMGTYGSRSLSVGGTAIVKALDKVIAKGKKIAAHLIEAADTDIEFENGEFTVKGTDKKVPWGSVALTAYVPHNYPLDKLEPGLNENAFYDPTNFTFPAGTYICEVEIDPETGKVKIDRFTAVDDFGNIVNPMIVEGQVHGGLAQGIGQALMEDCVYDAESGQLLTGSFMDYAMPRADRPAELQGRHTGHAVHPQPARREGLRRGRRDRLAAGRHQRRADRCARRQGHGDAGDGRARLARRAAQRRLTRTGPRRTHMYAFDYKRPASVADAKAALSGDARYLAGGQSLIQAMKLRLSSSERLVDLGAIADLKAITVEGNTVTIGAMATHAAVAASADVKRAIPALAELAGGIGDPMVRNMGTLGGSVANNDPAACYPARCSASARRCARTSARSRATRSSPACSRPR